jgi:hypothetical protein
LFGAVEARIVERGRSFMRLRTLQFSDRYRNAHHLTSELQGLRSFCGVCKECVIRGQASASVRPSFQRRNSLKALSSRESHMVDISGRVHPRCFAPVRSCHTARHAVRIKTQAAKPTLARDLRRSKAEMQPVASNLCVGWPHKPSHAPSVAWPSPFRSSAPDHGLSKPNRPRSHSHIGPVFQ